MGEIYFIAAGKKAIKIGFCGKRPDKRMKQLQTSIPYDLSLIGVIPGSRNTERSLHEKFYKHWIRGEWFEYNDEILDFIKSQTLVMSKKRSERILQGLVELNNKLNVASHFPEMNDLIAKVKANNKRLRGVSELPK